MIDPDAILFDAVAQAAQDTVVFIAAGDTLTRWAEVSTIVVAALLLVMAAIGVALLVQFFRLVKMTRTLMHDVQREVEPVSRSARVVGDNVAYVSAVVREDVGRLSESIGALAGRLQQASDRMEERIEEFNALLEVAQGEAEDLLIDTASTVRAVKASARSLSRPQGSAPRRGAEQE